MKPPEEPQTSVAILAGGRSARMGTNKALLRLLSGGPTLIEQVVSRLAKADLPAPLLITNTPQEYAFLGLPMLPDDLPGAGALGGILTALHHSPHDRTLVVACDMPLLNPDLLRYMAALHVEQDAIVPRWTDENGKQQVEPLHAIYTKRCIAPIQKRIEARQLKVSDFLEDITVRYLEEPELRRYDPQLASFRNVNTPEEWRSLMRDA